MTNLFKQQQSHVDSAKMMESRDHSNGVSPKNQKSRGNQRNLAIFLCLLFLAAFSTYAQNEKLRIAVLDIHSTYSGSSSLEDRSVSKAREITSILTTKLVNTNKYRVVERSRMQQIIKEQGFQRTQDISAHAVELGKLLGVQKIITGELSNHHDNWGVDYGTTNVRLIDVESGDIESAITIEDRYYDYGGKKQIPKNLQSHYLSNAEIAEKIVVDLLK